jgi:mRNA interferase RelE/StbE
MYNLEWKEYALQNLKNLEESTAKRIIKKVEELSENPFSKDIKKLKGIDGFRLRVGDYRVIFSVEKSTIQILKVGHRKNIYD